MDLRMPRPSIRLVFVVLVALVGPSVAGAGAADAVPDAGTGTADKPRRFEEQVEVVAEGATEADAPGELPVRPAEVMAVAGAADNVFRALQTLPGVAATAEFDSRLSVRGGSPDENLTVMDGVEIHNPYRLFGLTSAFNPETVRAFDLYAGAFSAKYGDRLSSLLVVENRPGTEEARLRGASALSLTDANVVLEGRLPGGARGSWFVAGRRTYYDLVANRIVGTDLPAFGDVQARADWHVGASGHLTFVGLLSRESTDASFEGDRAGEQGLFVTGTRNDLASLNFRTMLGRRVISRTIASFYRNREDLAADARFRADARRSNAPDDAVGFRVADVQFDRLLAVNDLSLRQELLVSAGRHLVEAGFEAHGLRTETTWRIAGDRNPNAANGSSVQGGAGLPDALDSAVDAARLGAWAQDRWDPIDALSLEGGLRLDWSGVNRRATLSPRLTASYRIDDATRVRAGGGLFTQSPGYEKLIQSDYFLDLTGGLGRSLRHERAAHAVVGLERDLAPGVTARVEGYWKGFRDLVVGRLETEAETEARVARYDFPAALAASVPTEARITSEPVNGAHAGGPGVSRCSSRKRAAPGAAVRRSYAYARARRDEYGLTRPFEYDRPTPRRSSARGASAVGPRGHAARVHRLPPHARPRPAGRRRRDARRPLRARARRRGTLRLRDDARGSREPRLGPAAGLRPPRPAALLAAAGRGRTLARLPRRAERDQPEERRPDRVLARVRPGLDARDAAAGGGAGGRRPFLPSFGVRSLLTRRAAGAPGFGVLASAGDRGRQEALA
ncbi:MAG: TonB-dependent receptor [Vicinamibacteria bacterium]